MKSPLLSAGFLAVSSLLRGSISSPCPALTAVPLEMHGAPVWELIWDDRVDGSIDRQAKTCRVRLDVRGGKVIGSFEGLVLGRPREARFSGELIPSGYTSLLLMEQSEPGYTCTYKMLVSGAGYLGVWHDTRGGKGDVELVQESSVTTTVSPP